MTPTYNNDQLEQRLSDLESRFESLRALIEFAQRNSIPLDGIPSMTNRYLESCSKFDFELAPFVDVNGVQ